MSAVDWEITAGRCGACTRFHKDYGSGARTYGHCGPKPRAGSITVTSFKCDGYVPREEVAPKPVIPVIPTTRPKIDPFDLTATTPLNPGRERPAPAPASKNTFGGSFRPSRPEPPERPTEIPRAVRDREPVDDLFDEEEEAVNRGELRDIIREAIEDSLGIGEAEMLDRFKGGTIVIRPSVAGTAEKELPIDALHHKIVMVRDNLRVLEQKINASSNLDDGEKVALQQYITRCYGSLTTFNMLFKNRDDWFKGSGS